MESLTLRHNQRKDWLMNTKPEWEIVEFACRGDLKTASWPRTLNIHFSAAVDFSGLVKMKATWASETSISYHINTRRHNPKDLDLNLW